MKETYRFYIVGKDNELIDTTKCQSFKEEEGYLTFKKSRFTEERTEKVNYVFNNYVGIATAIFGGALKGHVVAENGNVADGAYPALVYTNLGRNKVITEVWLKINDTTMKLWWSKSKGYIR